MRLTARLALVAVVLSAPVACARPSSPARSFGHAVSVTDLRTAPAALSGVGSGRFEVGVIVEGPDGSEEVGAAGAFADGAVVIDVDLRARLARAADRLGQSIPRGLDTEGRIVLRGSMMYVRVPMLHELTGGLGWLSAKSNEVSAAPAFESSVIDPLRLVGTLRGVVEVREVGHEVVRGVSTAQVGTTLPDGRALDVWLDAQHLVRRLRYVLDEVGEGLGRATVTVELFDYGAPVEIEVPGPGEAIPFSDLVHELLEAGA